MASTVVGATPAAPRGAPSAAGSSPLGDVFAALAAATHAAPAAIALQERGAEQDDQRITRGSRSPVVHKDARSHGVSGHAGTDTVPAGLTRAETAHSLGTAGRSAEGTPNAELDAAPNVTFSRVGTARGSGGMRLSELPRDPDATLRSGASARGLPHTHSTRGEMADTGGARSPAAAVLNAGIGAALASALTAPDESSSRTLPALPSASSLASFAARQSSVDALQAQVLPGSASAAALRHQPSEGASQRSVASVATSHARPDEVHRLLVDVRELQVQLKREQEMAQASAAAHAEESRAWRARVQHVEAQLAASQDAQIGLRDEVSRLGTQLENLASAKDAVHTAKQRLEAQLAAAAEAAQQGDAERRALSSQLQEVSAQNGQLVSAVVDLRSRVSELTARKDALELQQETRDAAHESEQKALLLKVAMYEQQVASLRRDLQDASQRVAAAEAALSAAGISWERRLAAEAEKARAEASAAFEARIAQTRAHFDDLVSRARGEGDARVESQRAEYDARIDALSKELAHAQQRVKELTSDVNVASVKVGDLQKQLTNSTATSHDEMQRLRSEAATAASELLRVRKDAAIADREHSEVQQVLRATRQQLSRSVSELTRAKAQQLVAEREAARLITVVQTIEATLADEQRRSAALERDLQLALHRAAKLSAGANLIPLKVQAVLKRAVPSRTEHMDEVLRNAKFNRTHPARERGVHRVADAHLRTAPQDAVAASASTPVALASVLERLLHASKDSETRLAELSSQLRASSASGDLLAEEAAADAKSSSNHVLAEHTEDITAIPPTAPVALTKTSPSAVPPKRAHSAATTRYLSRRMNRELLLQQRRSVSPQQQWQAGLRRTVSPGAWIAPLLRFSQVLRSPEAASAAGDLKESSATGSATHSGETIPPSSEPRLTTVSRADTVQRVELTPDVLRNSAPSLLLSPLRPPAAGDAPKPDVATLATALRSQQCSIDALRRDKAAAVAQREEAVKLRDGALQELTRLRGRVQLFRMQRDRASALAAHMQCDGVDMFRRLLGIIRPLAVRLAQLGEEAEVDPDVLVLPASFVGDVATPTDRDVEKHAFVTEHAHLQTQAPSSAATQPPKKAATSSNRRTAPVRRDVKQMGRPQTAVSTTKPDRSKLTAAYSILHSPLHGVHTERTADEPLRDSRHDEESLAESRSIVTGIPEFEDESAARSVLLHDEALATSAH